MHEKRKKKTETDLPECFFSGCPNPERIKTTMIGNEAICAALRAREEIAKEKRNMGKPFEDINVFIELTEKGSNRKKIVRVDRIKEITLLPDGTVYLYDERELRTGMLKGFPVQEGYETVIELCIRAGLQIIRKD